MVDYKNSYCTELIGGVKSTITGYDESLNWGSGRSKMAWWNLIKGFDKSFPIGNAGFETGDMTEWDTSSVNTIVQSGTVYSGIYSAKIDLDPLSLGILISNTNAVIGVRYKMSFWAKCDSGSVSFRFAIGTQLPEEYPVSAMLTTTWTKYTGHATATGLRGFQVYYNSSDAGNFIYVDDAKVELVSQQPANDSGAIPGTAIAVSNPSKCNPFVLLPFMVMLDLSFGDNLINMLTMM